MNNLIHKLGFERIGNYEYLENLTGGKAATLCKYKEISTGKIILFKFLIAPRSDAEREAFFSEFSSLELLTAETKNIPQLQTFPRLLFPLTKYENDGIYFFGIEYIEGMTLNKYFEQKPLPWHWRDALKIVYHIVKSLSSISQFFIVHSDLHPGNIMLRSGFDIDLNLEDERNGIVILDLGCSKNYFRQLFDNDNIKLDYFRHFGAMSSWSPEFLQNPKNADMSSDIWAIGALLYRLLVGKYHLDSKNFGEYYYNCVIDYKINLTEIKKLNLPFLVEQLVLATLQYKPTDRLLHKRIIDIIYDIFNSSILEQDIEFQKEYNAYRGDIWQCPQCGTIGPPNGNKCRGCGRFNEDWIKPF